jgi:hypothetical protein
MSAARDWDFESVVAEMDDDEREQLRDVSALIYAGLDQARSELGMPWTAVSHKAMIALSQQVAIVSRDWTAHEGLLVGTWMAASSRTQILQASEAPA